MRNKPCLTTADVDTMMAACRAEAKKNGWNVAIAIVDDAGYLLQFARTTDATGPATAEVAVGKAKAAALTRRETKDLEARVVERPAFVSYPYPNSILIWGGVPIVVDGDCVGAIGVSGRASNEDESIARAGIAALGIA